MPIPKEFVTEGEVIHELITMTKEMRKLFSKIGFTHNSEAIVSLNKIQCILEKQSNPPQQGVK